MKLKLVIFVKNTLWLWVSNLFELFHVYLTCINVIYNVFVHKQPQCSRRTNKRLWTEEIKSYKYNSKNRTIKQNFLQN